MVISKLAAFVIAASVTFAQYPSYSSAPGTSSGGGAGASQSMYSASALVLTAGTYYVPPGGGGAPSGTESNVQIQSAVGAKIQNLFVQQSVALGSGTTATYTYRNNGVDQPLSCTITDPDTFCSDTSDNFTAAQGDLQDIKIVTTGTVLATPNLGITSVLSNITIPPSPFFSLISHTAGQSLDGDTVTTSGINTTGSDFLFVMVACACSGVIPTPTDSEGNAWTGLATYNNGVRTIQVFYTVAPVTGGTHTITETATGNNPSVWFSSWSGASQGAQPDQSGFSTNNQLPNTTPIANHELVLTYIGTVNTPPLAPGPTAFTGLDILDSTATGYGGGVAYVIQGAAALVAPLWNANDANRITGINTFFH